MSTKPGIVAMLLLAGPAEVVLAGCPFEPDSQTSATDAGSASTSGTSTSLSTDDSAGTVMMETSATTASSTSATTATSSATTETSATDPVDSTGTVDDSSSADGSSTGAVAPPCADGEFSEGAEALWQREDIAICPNSDPTVLPASKGSAEALCSTTAGWRLCTVDQARERNNDCPPGFLGFAALVESGANNCAIFDNGDPSDPGHKCNSDFARAGFAGSCGGDENGSSWGFHERLQTGGVPHGALCCRD